MFLLAGALATAASALCPLTLPEELHDLYSYPHDFVLEGGTLWVNGQPATTVLPPGTCSIRFHAIAGWYWGDPQPMDIPDGGPNDYLEHNGDLDVLEDFEFAIWNLPLPGCQGPTIYNTPSSPSGQWVTNATRLVVQTDVTNYCGSLTLLDVDGVEPATPPEPTDPIDPPDPCAIPSFCYDLDNPCLGHVIDPDLCEESESALDLTLKVKVLVQSAVFHLGNLVEILEADPTSREAPSVLQTVVDLATTGEARFVELTSVRVNLDRELALHPELDDEEASLRSRAELETAIDLGDSILDRCIDAIDDLQAAQAAAGGLTASAATTARDRCASALHTAGRAADAARNLWSFGLADDPT